MKKVPIVFLSLVSVLGITGLLWYFIVFPSLRSSIEKRIQGWVRQRNIELRYNHITMNGLSLDISDVLITTTQFHAQGSISIEWNWIPGQHFADPRHISFNNWLIDWTRNPELKAEAQNKSNERAPADFSILSARFTNMIKDLLKYDMTFDVKESELRLLEGINPPLLELKKFSTHYNSSIKTLQFNLGMLSYRNIQAFRNLTGQILWPDDGSSIPILAHAEDNDQGLWQLSGSLDRNLDELEIHHKRVGLPHFLQNHMSWIASFDQVELQFRFRVRGLNKLEELSFSTELLSNNLHIRHHLLGPEPWGPFTLKIQNDGKFLSKSGGFEIENGQIVLQAKQGGPPLNLNFQAEKKDILLRPYSEPWVINIQLPRTECQTILGTIPAKNFLNPNEFKLSGSMSAKVRLHLFSHNQSEILWEPLANTFHCEIEKSPQRFTRTWLTDCNHDVFFEDECASPSLKALRSPDFVPKEKIPEDFFWGLISAEDSNFWQHKGIHIRSLQAALQANLKAGKFLYGASTITMQLVKNLYLSRDKILSRKLQEIFLAWIIEHNFTKDEILETYSNIVEFGPDIFGIASASRIYFGKNTDQLSRAEVVFLASILPSPLKAYRDNLCNGTLQSEWLTKMNKTAEGIALLMNNMVWQKFYKKELHLLRFAPPVDTKLCLQKIGGSQSRPDHKKL